MHPGKKTVISIISSVMLLTSVPAWALDVSLNGFLQGNYSLNTASDNPDGHDYKWAEERGQLKLDATAGSFRLFSKTDLFYDHIDEEADVEFRELYLDYTAMTFDARAGRQIITWGLGDLIFINDVFPKDYEAFFSGRPLEYLKVGVDGLKVGIYPGIVSLDVVVIPYFEPNNFPDEDRFWMYDPLPMVTDREKKEPSTTLDNTEIAARLYRTFAGIDAALYYYRGFFRNPSMRSDDPVMPAKLTLFYPDRSVYGASLQGNALGGVLGLEAGYYDSQEDRDGTDPMVPNSSTRFLTAYQRQLWKDFTAGIQYYGEYMDKYSNYEKNLPGGFPKQKRYVDLITVRLTQFLMHQTLKLSFFSFWGPSEGDYLINPEIKYSFTDNIWAAVGAMVFGGGDDWDQFGQFDKNDNMYLQARYEF